MTSRSGFIKLFSWSCLVFSMVYSLHFLRRCHCLEFRRWVLSPMIFLKACDRKIIVSWIITSGNGSICIPVWGCNAWKIPHTHTNFALIHISLHSFAQQGKPKMKSVMQFSGAERMFWRINFPIISEAFSGEPYMMLIGCIEILDRLDSSNLQKI